jgi:Ca2+-binding EF-hand superfamily protein
MRKKISFHIDPNDTSLTDQTEKKKNYLIHKFNLTKEILDINDITQLIKNLNSINIENIKEETSKLILNIFDKSKTGKISRNEFIDEIIKRNSSDMIINNEIDMFFIELNQAVATTSEEIISKLKKNKKSKLDER